MTQWTGEMMGEVIIRRDMVWREMMEMVMKGSKKTDGRRRRRRKLVRRRDYDKRYREDKER